MTSNNLFLAVIWLVSLASIGYEILLTRYFSVANWSEYGYFIISIAMVGYAFSGVLLSLAKDFFVKRVKLFFLTIPILLMLVAAFGFYYVSINPFNPLELQNRVLWVDQLVNIGWYYIALFPFFFLSGLFIGLSFIYFQDDIPKLYAFDLVGAGFGAAILLFAMFYIHPFYLLVVILPFVWLSAIFVEWFSLVSGFIKGRFAAFSLFLLSTVVLGFCEWIVINHNRADFCEYKVIYPSLNVEGNRIVETVKHPLGYYMLLDNFNERPNVDLSNNYAVMGLDGPPRSFGLYKDGNRVTAIPMDDNPRMDYVDLALDSFPYHLRKPENVLLVGVGGGFRVREARQLGAKDITAVEPDDVVFKFVERQNLNVIKTTPHSLLATTDKKFSIIDIAPEYLDEGEINKHAFTVEAFREFLSALDKKGIVSVPISISEFTVYALKLYETARQALFEMGVVDPERNIIVYRSSWSVRILLSMTPFSEEDIEKLKLFCSDRSFDTSFYYGIIPKSVEIWNELPAFHFDDTEDDNADEKDALMTDILTINLDKGVRTVERKYFNLSPATEDRPFFYSTLRLSKIGGIFDKIEMVPREEIGYLINLAVLIPAGLFALLVIVLPLLRLKHNRGHGRLIMREIVYFMCLGLAFLFIEIALIDRFAPLLNNKGLSFALLSSGLLIFSGIGSYISGYFNQRPQKGVFMAVVIIAVSCLFYAKGLPQVAGLVINASLLLKTTMVLFLILPAGLAMGMMFPLGMSQFRGEFSDLLPWAWGINGAFSVISTPLAGIIAVSFGYSAILFVSAFLYMIALLFFPKNDALATNI